MPDISITNRFNVFSVPASASFGGVTVDVSIEELHNDVVEVTEHPVENGASITDHSYKRQAEVVMRCGWSNSNFTSLLDFVDNLVTGGSMSANDYISSIYSRLLNIQGARQPVQLATTKRIYDNMMVAGLQCTNDQRTANALLLTATFKEVILVSTRSTTIAPQSAQAFPADTAEVQDRGQVSPLVSILPSEAHIRGVQ